MNGLLRRKEKMQHLKTGERVKGDKKGYVENSCKIAKNNLTNTDHRTKINHKSEKWIEVTCQVNVIIFNI